MHINTTGGERAKLVAADAVTRMNGKMRYKLSVEDQQRLAAAIVRSGAQDDLLFRNAPVRFTPTMWSLSGILSRITLLWKRWCLGDKAQDEGAALSEVHYKVRQSGALVIALFASIVCGVFEVGLPAELALQMARDKARPIAASGDIVVIAQDDKSAERFGRWPWPRRYDAALIDKLREMGAKTIVFNGVFSEASDPENDMKFASALDRAGGKVWLSAYSDHDAVSGANRPVMPLLLFRAKSRQANSYFWNDAFGFAKNIPLSSNIDAKNYISSAVVLTSVMPPVQNFRPDMAIRYKTIPTISMADILKGEVDRSAIEGKSIIVGLTISGNGDVHRILGQSSGAPTVYTRVIAAETIKNGIARDLGWLPPLLAAALISLACVMQQARRRRAWSLMAGGIGLLAVMLIGDRIGLHFEMVPALLLLSFFAVREAVKRKVIAARTTHPVSGLPNLTELYYIKVREACTILALKVEQYPAVIGNLPPERQREMILAVAARIAIVCPDSIVHQGDDGLFVWLIPHDSEGDIDTLPGQLLALFMVDVSDSYTIRMIGVSVGRCADMALNFGERLAVASDRAKAAGYITLREVL